MADHVRDDSVSFIKYHLVLPLIALMVLLLCLEFSELDIWIAQHFYDPLRHQWPYKELWITQTLLHKGGRYLVYGIGIGLLGLWLSSCRSSSALSNHSKSLGFLLAASLAGPLIITLLKSHTHIYCPWDLSLFGGSKPHIKLLDPLTEDLKVGHCYPAGHSGLGFAFVSLYFFFWLLKAEYKHYGLATGLLIGTVFGIDQEIRGAHFLSHDLMALAICWFSSVFVFLLYSKFCNN